MADFTTIQLLSAALIGLIAGLLGGLAGVGGSMIMLPALHLVFGDDPANVHHLYMAAAMTVNVAVSFPAAVRHGRHGAVRTDLLPSLLMFTALAIVAGVLLSNMFDGNVLRYLLAAFILAYCVFNMVRLIRNAPEHTRAEERTGRTNLAISGAGTGLVGGLLGLGGGVLLVPMLQMLCRVPLRGAIATSSAVICMTAVIGAGFKLSTLPHGLSARDALWLALLMAPTAMLGGHLGAFLTHALPLRLVRGAITLLLMLAAARLAGL